MGPKLIKTHQLADTVNDFKQYMQAEGKSVKTVDGYLQDMRLFAAWFFAVNGEDLSPEALTRVDAQQYKNYLISDEVKARPATVNRKLAALRCYSEWAKAAGKVEYNAVNDLKNVSEQTVAPKWLEKKHQADLLRELEKEITAARTVSAKRQALRDMTVGVLLINTGLRISELCTLDIEDILLSDNSGEVRVRNGKGSKARTVPLNRDARLILDHWIEERKKFAGEGDHALFFNKRGERLQSRGIQFMLTEMGSRIHVKLTPHTLRHTFAKNLVNSGVSLEKVAMLLGHSKLNTTMVYTTPGRTDLEKAVESLV